MVGRTSALLQSKLRPPTVPSYFIQRQRLVELLDAVGDRPLTIVVAPAGSGKTQLVASWVAMRPATSWLSVEESDDDPTSLWNGIIAALDPLAPGCGSDALPLLTSSAPAGDVVRVLLQSLEAAAAPPSVLVLDDVHLVRDPEATSALAVFVQHLPEWLHVVMVSRAEPPLPLDRLKVRGHVAEIRFADLRFTPDEARSVLAHLAPELTEDELTESIRHTDGWAAGVQLAALAARSALAQPAPVSLGAAMQLRTEDYVWHEVLAAGNPDVIEVLLQISIVERVNAPLAMAITERTDARELLVEAEAQGLFVYRLGTGGWFQIHALVREVLLNELVRQGRHRAFHARAARWWEDSNEISEALAHWLLADRPREALRLLGAQSTDLYNQGRESVIVRTIDAIPREVAANDVPALIDYAVSHLLVSRSRFLDAVRDVVWYAERSAGAYDPQVAALQSIAAIVRGDWSSGGAAARRSLDLLGDEWSHDVAGRFSWNLAARDVALSERWDDDDELVLAASIQMGSEPSRGLSFEGIRALGYALAGHPIDALQVSAGISHAAATMSILRTELKLADAIARREIGDRTRGIDELRSIADDPDDLRLYCPVGAHLELALAAVDDGNPDEAARELELAESLLEGERAGIDLRDWVERVATVVAISLGDVEGARQRAKAVIDPFWGPASRARVQLASGDRAAAQDELAGALPRSVRHRVVLDLLRAGASTVSDDTRDHVTSAVRLAAAHGLLQSVVYDARELVEEVERAAWAVPEEWLHRLRLAMTGTTVVPASGHYEPLTQREREVLRLLPSRLTLNEIASELFVSVNTLKFHLRVIYRKLGVNSRDEAAAHARAMTTVASKSSR